MSTCPWALRSPLEQVYHDTEWGVPLFDDARLFELLVLETMQAGLSWTLVLQRREGMRAAFDGFDPAAIARYDGQKLQALQTDERIIRNRLKLASLPQNARAFLRVQQEFGGFAAYLWAFVDGKPHINHWRQPDEVPAQTALSQAISHDMRSRGFSFLGPVTVYAFMQAAGLVNDHLVTCTRHPVHTTSP